MHTCDACTTVKTATPKKRKKSIVRNDMAPGWWVAEWLSHAPKDWAAVGSFAIPTTQN